MKLAGLQSFIDSKNQLLDIIQRDPIHGVSYTVSKYCRVPVGETKNDKQYVQLKPKQTLTINWQYTNDLSEPPTPVDITFNFMVENNTHRMFQTGAKLRKWLSTNTFETTKQ